MKYDLAWLSEWVGELPPAEKLAQLLTQAGLEVSAQDDTALELDLTPNRGDCLSIRGLAREVLALTGKELPEPQEPGNISASLEKKPSLGDIEPEACPYYSLRLIEQVNPEAKTPKWMQDRLERCGMRAHHLLVDVTNYVMLELGQPLHAFDADAVAGSVSVRWAHDHEMTRALDATQLSLDSDMLVITAQDHPIAVAGIIGSSGAAVSESTCRVLLESAHFAPQAIAGRARRLKLHTESSHRFERGVDPRLPPHALQRATELILKYGGGKVSAVVHSGRRAPTHRPGGIRLRSVRLVKCLGVEVADVEVERILNALGCRVRKSGRQWEVFAPIWRFDLQIEEDLIEEVARVYGYDRIPSAPAPLPGEWAVPAQPWAAQIRHCQQRLVERGYSEAVTYSFTEEKLEQRFAPLSQAWRLVNPISQEQAVLRSTLVPSLLRAAQYNLNRQQPGVRLFEMAGVFAYDGTDVHETRVLGGVACGTAYPLQWGAPARDIDFYDVKGDLESLLQGLPGPPEFSPVEHPALHPGQTACVTLGGKKIGILGALHPQLFDEFDLNSPAFVFELELDVWSRFPKPEFAPWSEYPAVARDLNVVVPEEIAAAEVSDCVRSLGIESLQDVSVFDVYQGEKLPPQRKSLGLHLIFQSFTGTLKEPEVGEHLERVIAQLAKLLRAETRGWTKP